jgi:MFS family permease
MNNPGVAGYSIVPALLPQFIEAWSLTNTEAGWLAGMVSAGYMLAVIPLVSLTDRWPARHIYLASSTFSALSCFGIALCDSLLSALGFRALAGIAMAGMYNARPTGTHARSRRDHACAAIPVVANSGWREGLPVWAAPGGEPMVRLQDQLT